MLLSLSFSINYLNQKDLQLQAKIERSFVLNLTINKTVRIMIQDKLHFVCVILVKKEFEALKLCRQKIILLLELELVQ